MKAWSFVERRATAMLWLVLAAGVVGGALFYRARPLDVRLVEVELGEVRREAVGIGTLESEAVVTLSFTASGRVTSLSVDEGQTVAAGQVVATLDVATLEKQRGVSVAGVDLATAGLVKAEAEVARARATLDGARLSLSRAESLTAAGALSQAALDSARESAARSEAELSAAQAALTERRSAHAVAQKTVAVQSQQVGDGVLRSPIDGVIVRRHREAGDVVGVGAAVLTVASTRKLWARVWVDETALPSLREGLEARVLLRGDEGRPLSAKVDRIAPEADRQTHEVLVDLELHDRPARVVFGQRAEAHILLERRSSAPKAPRAACDLRAGRCWTARLGAITETPVTFGLVGRDHVELLDGVRPGEMLVDRSAFTADPPAGRRLVQSAR